LSDTQGTVLLVGQPHGSVAADCAESAAEAGFCCHPEPDMAGALRYLSLPESAPELILIEVDRLSEADLSLLPSVRELEPLGKIVLCHSAFGAGKARGALDAGADWIWPSALAGQALARVLRTREYERPGRLPGATREDRLARPIEPVGVGPASAPVLAFGWHEGVLGLVRDVLEQAGCVVRVSTDPAGVPERVAREQVSVGVFDCWDGARDRERRVMSAWRRAAESVPLLALVDTTRREDVRALLDAGADACLAKPFLNAELCDWVRALRGRRVEGGGLLSEAEVTALLGPR